MSLKETIQQDYKSALLGGDRFRAGAINMLKAAILSEEIDKLKRDEGLSDQEIEVVVAREIKKRKESVELYRAGSREDLAHDEEQEIEILSKYLPEQISEEELSAKVEAKIAELGAQNDPKAMGQVISALKTEFGSTVDGKLLSETVKAKLIS